MFRGRVAALILRSVLAPGAERAEMREKYAPELALDPTGSYWYRTWLMLRDSQSFWPWYNQTLTGRRQVPADFGGEFLHNWTFEVLKQWHSYHHVINAVLDQEPEIAGVLQRTLLVSDPLHAFAVYADKVAALCPKAKRAVAVQDVLATASEITGFLHGA
jgi:hypothetical protein